MYLRLKRLYADVIFCLVGYIPGAVGIILRRFFYRGLLGNIGHRVTIGIGVRLNSPENIYLGDDVWLDDYCILTAGKASSANRVYWYKKECTTNTMIEDGIIKISKGVHVAPYVFLQGHGGLFIGDYCTIGSGSTIYSLSHHYRTFEPIPVAGLICKYSSMAPRDEQSLIIGAVVVGNYCAVTPHCTLLPGAHLGEGSWLLMGSVLSVDIPPYKMVAGNPAVVIKERCIG